MITRWILRGGLAAGIAGLLLAAAACSRAPRVEANALLPAAGLAAGWARAETPRVFPAGELWRYIDGDADKYVQAGVQTTVAAAYKNPPLEANADVHVMATGDAARKLFESEPAAGAIAASVGVAGRAYSGSVTFYRGRYFVRLVAFTKTAQTGASLLALARSIDDALASQ